MDSHVFLHKGYFWSAGKQFGWAESDPGVGIAYKKIKEALPYGRVYVKSKYDKMSILAKIANGIVFKYKSFYMANNTKIAVIPKSRFVKDKVKKNWQQEKRDRELVEMEKQGQGKLI